MGEKKAHDHVMYVTSVLSLLFASLFVGVELTVPKDTQCQVGGFWVPTPHRKTLLYVFGIGSLLFLLLTLGVLLAKPSSVKKESS